MEDRLERAIPDRLSPKREKDEDELGPKRTPSETKQEQQEETGHPATATTNVEMMNNEKAQRNRCDNDEHEKDDKHFQYYTMKS